MSILISALLAVLFQAQTSVLEDNACDFKMVAGESIPAPWIAFLDLDSAPNTGGENNKGAYVTIWGSGFGFSRGTSTVSFSGGAVDHCPVWQDGKISCQIGPDAKTGLVVITTRTGTSNGVPFTVGSGKIYFVAPTGDDGANGSFGSPFRSLPQCAEVMQPGDICYAMNGSSQSTVDDYNSALAIRTAGVAGQPLAIVAYPGATVSIGSNALQYGIRTPAIDGSKDHWVFSQLQIVAGATGMDLVDVQDWKVVGNDISCPNGSGQTACFHTDTANSLKFWANYVHDVGSTSGSIDKYYHAVYFSTNSNNIDVGWNTIVPNPAQSKSSGGCRALQFYSTGGSDQYNLHVHDNVIHDAICDGINFATVNADRGTVEAYNNVVYRVGTGPDPGDGSANYACVNTGGGGAAANIEIYNNSFYDCGSRGTQSSGAFTLSSPTRLRNNISYQVSSEYYFNGGSSLLTGVANVWYGAGGGPTQCQSNINADPQFVNARQQQFHLRVSSPARGKGVIIPSLTTYNDGVMRLPSAPFDLGALSVTLPTCRPLHINR